MWQKGHLGGRYMGVGYSLHFSVYLNFSKWFLMKGRTRLVEWTSDPESQPHRKGFRTRSHLPAPWEGGVGVPQDLRAHPTLSPVEHLANGATTSFWFRFVVHLSVEHEMSVFPCQCWQFLKVSSESYLNVFAYRRAIFRQIFMSLLKKAEMLRGGPMSSPLAKILFSGHCHPQTPW